MLPYVMNNGNLENFLQEIQSASVPAVVDNKYLQSRGYTGQNDKMLISLLRTLGFIDKSGAPCQRWLDHRHSYQSKEVRGEAVREAYRGFFDIYSDADKRTEEDFSNWARVEDPKASPTTIKRSWATRTLTKLAQFDTVPSSASHPGIVEDVKEDDYTSVPASKSKIQVGSMGALTINIELQLPATADAEFFERLFSSMRRHLVGE